MAIRSHLQGEYGLPRQCAHWLAMTGACTGGCLAHPTATARRGRRALHWDAVFNGMHLVGHDHWACRLYKLLPCTHHCHGAGVVAPYRVREELFLVWR